jgi:hypothetical protein
MRLKTEGFFWAFAVLGCGLALTQPAGAEDRIYRCGNEYTNTPVNIKNCEVLQAQTLTVIQGTRPLGASKTQAPTVPTASSGTAGTTDRSKMALLASSSAPAAAPSTGRAAPTEPVDPSFREVQKRTILVSELKQVRERHAQLVQEYSAGEPDKLGSESRNHQKYLDRLANLKAGIGRAERDMDSLQKELARLPSNPMASP